MAETALKPPASIPTSAQPEPPTPAPTPTPTPEPPKPALKTMKLKRNYAPRGYYEVVSRAEHEQPGVGFANKLWAGSVIRVPEDEGRDLYAADIAERGFDD